MPSDPAQQAEDFAQALQRVYEQKQIWTQVRNQGLNYLQERQVNAQDILLSLLEGKTEAKPAPPTVKRPILVTGAHRSGSTWTGKMLALAENAYYLHEPFNVGLRPDSPFEDWFTYLDPDQDLESQKGLL